MPLVLIATPGAADANSFVDLDTALAILETMPWRGAWPLPTAASATVGSGADGTVTVAAAETGPDGNGLAVTVAAGAGASVPLSAVAVGGELTVTLATNAASVPLAAANAAALVAAVVDALPDFTASASGTGLGAVAPSGRRPLAGGDDRADDIARLLIAATRWIRVKTCWTGAVTSGTQALPWPRVGMLDANGNAIPDDVVPGDLELATVALAVLLAKADVTAGNEIAEQGITRVKAGPIELDFKDEIAVADLPSAVSAYLVPSWLCPLAAGAGGATPFMFAIT